MIECSVNRLPGGLDFGKIQHPTQGGIDVAADGELDLKRMAMQARTGMGFGQGGQTTRALQMKDAEEVHAAFSRKFPTLAMQTLSGFLPSRYTANIPLFFEISMSAQRLSLATLAAFILLVITACSHENGPTLTAPDAYAKAQAGTLTLIDIRHPDEWRQTGVAKGALRIDMTDTQGEAGFVARVTAKMGGEKNAPIALLSLAGNRGGNAQQVLREAGFTQVYNVREGMNGSSAGPGWIARGLPIQPCPNY